jgi:hypothetical protein
VPEGKRVLRQAFKRLELEVPESLGRALRWLRHPASRLVRVPVGILFVLGGIFSILPGLGIWMLPCGLLLLAADVPFLRKPVGRFTIWGAEKWARFRAWLSWQWGNKSGRNDAAVAQVREPLSGDIRPEPAISTKARDERP